jgi:hypothetical protein
MADGKHSHSDRQSSPTSRINSQSSKSAISTNSPSSSCNSSLTRRGGRSSTAAQEHRQRTTDSLLPTWQDQQRTPIRCSSFPTTGRENAATMANNTSSRMECAGSRSSLTIFLHVAGGLIVCGVLRVGGAFILFQNYVDGREAVVRQEFQQENVIPLMQKLATQDFVAPAKQRTVCRSNNRNSHRRPTATATALILLTLLRVNCIKKSSCWTSKRLIAKSRFKSFCNMQ